MSLCQAEGCGCRTIYVAGSRHDRAIIHAYIKRLQAAGWAVMHDWTTHPGFDAPEPGPSEDVLVEAARVDLAAVCRARTFWYVAPEALSEGSSTELGAALVVAQEVVASGPLGRHRIFPRLAGRRFETHEEALAYLCESV